MSVPTYIFLNNGEVAKQIVGAQSKEVFSQHIDELLKEASQSKE
jgi:predicted DsbA family dithiol-disulfide isomerase